MFVDRAPGLFFISVLTGLFVIVTVCLAAGIAVAWIRNRKCTAAMRQLAYWFVVMLIAAGALAVLSDSLGIRTVWGFR